MAERGRNQSGCLAATLELWIPDSASSSHLAGRRAQRDVAASSPEKNKVRNRYCEFCVDTSVF